MKFLLQILMIFVLAFLMELVMPWWSIAIAAALAGILMGGNVGRSFVVGFFGVFLLWFGSALLLQYETGSELAVKVGGLLPGKPNPGVLAVVAGVIGGLVAGFAAASGDALRSMVVGKRTAK